MNDLNQTNASRTKEMNGIVSKLKKCDRLFSGLIISFFCLGFMVLVYLALSLYK